MDEDHRRKLDAVIDDVARAMTSDTLTRDLRPAITLRAVRPSAWSVGWRLGIAAGATAALALAVIVMRPESEPSRTPPAVAVSSGPASAPAAGPDRVAVAPATTAANERPRLATVRRAVERQTVADTPATESVVAIAPLALAPVEAETLTPLEQVEIAPIDVEPISLSQLVE